MYLFQVLDLLADLQVLCGSIPLTISHILVLAQHTGSIKVVWQHGECAGKTRCVTVFSPVLWRLWQYDVLGYLWCYPIPHLVWQYYNVGHTKLSRYLQICTVVVFPHPVLHVTQDVVLLALRYAIATVAITQHISYAMLAVLRAALQLFFCCSMLLCYYHVVAHLRLSLRISQSVEG